MQRRKTHAAKMLEALSDGRRWSTHELVEYGCGYAVHSRASDLRNRGYGVSNTRQNAREESPVYFYELTSLPPVPSPLEEPINPDAAARLQAMRASQTYASTPVGDSAVTSTAPVQGELVRAIDASEKASPLPPKAGGRHNPPSPAAGSPSSRERWIADLAGELRAVDDEIASLRSQLFLEHEDSERLEHLLGRSAELLRRIDQLGKRAAA